MRNNALYTLTLALIVGPCHASAQHLASATFTPNVVNGGTLTTCTIRLRRPARSPGVVVLVTNSHPFVQMPLSLTIPTGMQTYSFSVPIGNVSTNRGATVYFNAGTKSVKAHLTVLAPAGRAGHFRSRNARRAAAAR
ncbi:MAG TPA: hypothetical protein VG944_04930 [Fimbriimonas sp.]|nr:hypothetical protein [Fimbriimonas sp.]